MAHPLTSMSSDIPVDGDGVCMRCKAKPPEAENVLCRTCATPWHVQCLTNPPETLAAAADWLCPDCSDNFAGGGSVAAAVGSGDLVARIRAIEADAKLDEKEKARRRQALVSGVAQDKDVEEQDKGREKGGDRYVMDLIDESFKCSICMQLPERPVTTPCGHNFCLKCFLKWVGQGKRQCANCRAVIPSKVASQPRINSALVAAIRRAKFAKPVTMGPSKQYLDMENESRPDKAFTTERAKRAGLSNAKSGKIFVTVPQDHFGPIPAENDPVRNMGLMVGEVWDSRLECRQWGAHRPHVAGIHGQSDYGAQSVVLSGGYEDDEDHGEWFLYTGSGGRDLSGNKRTNKEQSSEQEFTKSNQALRVSCLKGYPVRVVRSFKEKRSSYAPEKGLRYDGIYRIEKCWRKSGIQGFLVCRYLFVRCDNQPAPWTSDEHGDRPRPLPVIKELVGASNVTERKDSPSWDYDETKGWTWVKPPPESKQPVTSLDPSELKRARKAIRRAHNTSVREQLLKDFSCQICHQVMALPLSTPCGHSFCEPCLHGFYADKSSVKARVTAGGRTLRARKIVKKCPACSTDIADYLENAQVNRQVKDMIERLQREAEGNELAAEEDYEDDDLDEDEAGPNDEDDAKEGSEQEVVEPIEVNSEEDVKRGRQDVADVPQKRMKATVKEEGKVAVSEDAAESPASALTASAQDDEV